MKCVLIITAVFFVYCQALSQEAKELDMKVQASLKKCTELNNLTDEQFEKFKKHPLPMDKNVQCTIACIAKEMEIMKNDDNSLDREKIASLLKILIDNSEVKREDNIQKCKEVLDICLKSHKANSDECVSANNFAECFIENGKKNGLLEF